jgi:hypothetical protein
LSQYSAQQHSPDGSIFAGSKKAIISRTQADLGDLIGVSTKFSQNLVVIKAQVVD